MIPLLLATVIGPIPMVKPCRVPAHALIVQVETLQQNREIQIFDRDDGSRVCRIVLPNGLQARFTVATDGRIFTAIPGNKQTDYTTDGGHFDIISPNGQILHRLSRVDGAADVALDTHGHAFLSTGKENYLNGETLAINGTLSMYDDKLLTRLRTFDTGAGYGGAFALGPDGKTIAVILGGYVAGGRTADYHLRVFDTTTGKTTIDIPVPKSSNFPSVRYDGSDVIVGSDSRELHVQSTPVGYVLIEVKPVEAKADAPTWRETFAGVTYESRAISEGLWYTSTIMRLESASGRNQPPIAIQGLATGAFVVDPNPELATAVAGKELEPPQFPTLAERRSASPTGTHGLQFDDAISGRRFTYFGNVARIDDPRAHVLTIVDCARKLALVANTDKQTYRVLSMDPTTIDQHGPPKPFYRRLKPPASATLSYANVAREKLHSAAASVGFESQFTFADGNSPQRYMEGAEEEYAIPSPAIQLTCARHSFDGEPLEIEPGFKSSLPSASFVRNTYPPDVLHIDGAEPMVPLGALRVFAASRHNQQWSTLVDVKHILQIPVTDMSMFEPPSRFAQDRDINY